MYILLYVKVFAACVEQGYILDPLRSLPRDLGRTPSCTCPRGTPLEDPDVGCCLRSKKSFHRFAVPLPFTREAKTREMARKASKNKLRVFAPSRWKLISPVLPRVLCVQHETAGRRMDAVPSLTKTKRDKTPPRFLFLFLLTLASASSSLFQKEKERPKITI